MLSLRVNGSYERYLIRNIFTLSIDLLSVWLTPVQTNCFQAIDPGWCQLRCWGDIRRYSMDFFETRQRRFATVDHLCDVPLSRRPGH